MIEEELPSQYEVLRKWIKSQKPNTKGEWRMKCPLAEHTNPTSASINFEKGVWSCRVPSCPSGGGGSIKDLMIDLKLETNVIPINRSKSNPDLTEGNVQRFISNLWKANERYLRILKERRGLTEKTIRDFQLGLDYRCKPAGRITVPIRDEHGTLVNIRKYYSDMFSGHKVGSKWINVTDSQIIPFPLSQINCGEDILIVEGELDALIAIQNGFPAISGTSGSSAWNQEWGAYLTNKNVFISYDNDESGEAGAQKVYRNVKKYAKSTVILEPLMPELEASDITDWFVRGGGTPTRLRAIMAASIASGASEATANSEPIRVGLLDAIHDGHNLLKTVSTEAIITGSYEIPYAVPKSFKFECSIDYGPKYCQTCPMSSLHGNMEFKIEDTEADVIREFIVTSSDKFPDVIKRRVGIPTKCPMVEWTNRVNEDGWHSIKKVLVQHPLDSNVTDRTVYPVYNVNNQISGNITVKMTGMSVPSAKPNSPNIEFFVSRIEPSSTQLEDFKMNKVIREQSEIFTSTDHKSPKAYNKCREISEDLMYNVTSIVGRHRMHMAMDLVFHSVLNFNIRDREVGHGWLELLIIGDTQTGKSQAAKRTLEHYGLGAIVNCEGASYAGLVGGVEGQGNERRISWGSLVLNDKRLVILDEVSGFRSGEISRFSEVRTSGLAKISKIQAGQALARCRLIWLSNPRISDTSYYGIDKITNLIENPEDIARFDIAMSTHMEDVSFEEINSRKKVSHVYTSELCHNLVLWAWSRRSDQVVWTPDALRNLRSDSIGLCHTYESNPPLIQQSSIYEKLARIAVAFAARTFSCDKTGEKIVVTDDHVLSASFFLEDLYEYDRFGYAFRSEAIQAKREIAEDSVKDVEKVLKENPRVKKFFVSMAPGEFRADNFSERCGMNRDEGNKILSNLFGFGMLGNGNKGQFSMEPEFTRLIQSIRLKKKEIE